MTGSRQALRRRGLEGAARPSCRVCRLSQAGVLDPRPSRNPAGRHCRVWPGVVWFKPADNRRVSHLGALGGWDQMRSRLRHDQLFFFSTCTEAIRTIPLLQHDQDRPEDLDTEESRRRQRALCLHVAALHPVGTEAEGARAHARHRPDHS